MGVTSSSTKNRKQMPLKPSVKDFKLPDGRDDAFGGITVDIKEQMDPKVFAHVLRASLSQWKQQGKKGIWIKLPIELADLVGVTVQEGFRYHHAEPSYLMLVKWIPETNDTIPANASHRVGIGAFVRNDKGEVLVVQEKNGKFKGSGVWKFPTGVVDEGEDICMAAIREVKEETGIETEFLEILAFRSQRKRNMFSNKPVTLFVLWLCVSFLKINCEVETQKNEESNPCLNCSECQYPCIAQPPPAVGVENCPPTPKCCQTYPYQSYTPPMPYYTPVPYNSYSSANSMKILIKGSVVNFLIFLFVSVLNIV